MQRDEFRNALDALIFDARNLGADDLVEALMEAAVQLRIGRRAIGNSPVDLIKHCSNAGDHRSSGFSARVIPSGMRKGGLIK